MIEPPGDAAVDRPTNTGKTPIPRRYAHCSSGRSMLPRIVSLFFLAVTFACSGCFLFPSSDYSPPLEQPMQTEGDAEADWSLVVGQSDAQHFAGMAEGEHLKKVHGTQGGYHVPVSARLEGPTVRRELEAKKSASGYTYMNVEVEVVAGSKVVSRSTSMLAATPVEDTSVDFTNLYAYLDADVRGEVTITVKVATDDKTKWASASRHVFVDD